MERAVTWFWQNRSQCDITVKLKTVGFYPFALEMRDGHVYRHDFKQP